MPSYVALILLACLMYAIENVILDVRLKEVHPLVTMTASASVACGISIMISWYNSPLIRQQITTMTREQWLYVVIISLLAAGGGYCFYWSYGSGGDAAKIPIIATALPIMAIAIRSIYLRELPAWNDVMAFVLVFIAVVLVSMKRGP